MAETITFSSGLERVLPTCIFKGLGPQKEEFLEKVVQMLEKKEFRKVDSFELEAFYRRHKSLKSQGFFESISKDTDITLEHKRGVILLRSHVLNKDLKLSYLLNWESFASKKSRLILLMLFSFLILGAVGFMFIHLALLEAIETLEGWETLWIFTWMGMVPFIWALFYFALNEVKQIKSEINEGITKIAESMGGKPASPFIEIKLPEMEKWDSITLKDLAQRKEILLDKITQVLGLRYYSAIGLLISKNGVIWLRTDTLNGDLRIAYTYDRKSNVFNGSPITGDETIEMFCLSLFFIGFMMPSIVGHYFGTLAGLLSMIPFFLPVIVFPLYKWRSKRQMKKKIEQYIIETAESLTKTK